MLKSLFTKRFIVLWALSKTFIASFAFKSLSTPLNDNCPLNRPPMLNCSAECLVSSQPFGVVCPELYVLLLVIFVKDLLAFAPSCFAPSTIFVPTCLAPSIIFLPWVAIAVPAAVAFSLLQI